MASISLSGAPSCSFYLQEAARNEAGDVAGHATQAATGGQDPTVTGDVDVRTGAAAGVEKAKEKVPEDVAQESRSRAEQLKEQTRSYLAQKMPKERREQAIWRLKKMILEIQGHPDCMLSLERPMTCVKSGG